MKEVIARIKGLLADSGLTAKQFGIDIGLKKSPFNDWDAGKSAPTVPQILRICEIFGVSANWILTGEEHSDGNTATDVSYSAVVQGSNSGPVTVNNGSRERKLSDEAVELLRIYETLNIKSRMKLLEAAFALEEEK
ncbi:hypothetical protein FACS1894216_02140 [Synergistales bacterium]|nr:hypothetical protein FACS1894216_02140 [Synergistales bacterium]